MDNQDAYTALLAARSLISSVAPDLSDPHLMGTPERIVKMYEEFFNPPVPSITTFDTEESEMVVLDPIPFYSLCAHHWLPFFGSVKVGYLPDKKIIGLSKIARIVKYLAQQPQVQERLTTQIADYLMYRAGDLNPLGVGVIVEGRHFCMEMRGVEAPGVITRTSALRGSFRDLDIQRQEFLQLTDRKA